MMSKKTFSRLSAAILLLLTVSIPVGAQEISVEAARQTAAKFINEHAAKLPAKSRKGMMKAPPKAESLQLVYTQEDQLHESPALYVFEQPKQGGFIIASADDRAYPILGYSETGTFREDSLPCCLKFILEEYGRQIAEARKQNLPRHTEKAENESWQNIEPLLTCAWDQGAPFNNLCPIDKNTGQRCVTGCVATAMAQIMYYWKWPERGVGSRSYQWRDTTLTANFGETTYRWDLMKDDYNYQNGYDDPEDAVATLMYHCGVALYMNYSSFGSGAGDIHHPIKDCFNYSNLKTYASNNHSIYEELSHKRPVKISGVTSTSSDGVGHAYICDGYRTDGYFHFNLGWGRYANGYYKMNSVSGFNSTSAEIRIAPKEEMVDYYGNIYEALDGKAYLTKGSDVKGHLEIPAQVTSSDGTKLPVVEISSGAYSNNTSITSVTIPNSVTTIGRGAFWGCSGLKSITIPNSVTHIDDRAFCYCSGLTSVTIGSSVTIIGDAFLGCSGLTSITIPNSVTSIDDMAFINCSGLTAINVEDGNTAYCSVDGVLFNKLQTELIRYPENKQNNSYTIPNSVMTIGGHAFHSCKGLKSINIPNSVTSIGEYAFRNCSGLKNVTIPNSVTTISNGAFDGCHGLISVTIPNSVTSIGRQAFYVCIGLTSVISCIQNPFAIASNTFELYGHFNEKNEYESPFTDATLYVPVGTSEKYKSTDGWKNFKNIVEIEIDGIENVTVSNSNSSDSENAPMYNLSGQRVGKNYKGIVIKNGKKMIVK